jgi:hypothetical protein
MIQSAEDLKIEAYLAPHPLDDFSGLEDEYLTWIPGFLNEVDEIEELPAIYRECNIKIYDEIEALTEFHFRNSIKNLWPLLSKIQFNSLMVAIDITGALTKQQNTSASYLYEKSSQIEGKYTFGLDRNLLHSYLQAQVKKTALDEHDQSVWEHELIHMLDHENILKGSIYGSSDSPSENFKYFFLKFRQEGIANLYYTLKGNTKIENLDRAIKEFIKFSIEKKAKLDFTRPTNEEIVDELLNGFEYYTIGPWIILDLLRDQWENIDIHHEMIEKCIENLEKKQPIEEETILEVIKLGLQLNPITYLKMIEKYFDKGFMPI